MSWLPKLLTPEDVRQLQAALATSVDQIDPAVKACTKLDDTTKAAWKTFRDTVRGYATVGVRGFGELDWEQSAMALVFPLSLLKTIWGSSTDDFYARGRAYEAEVADWETKIIAAGCPLVAPQHVVPKDPPPSDPLGEIANIAKWIGIAAAAAAGAYVVSKIVPVIAEGVGITHEVVDSLGNKRSTSTQIGGSNRSRGRKELNR